ncbi:outer membrane protein assembly factor BamE [Rodentibacter caecimuris]|uniref:Outer membrane protein assembly factor BamE n=1 Tax=Rodentibacter caecimuris TaxID=1796644 RepID=A0ABX3KWK3_9PAST|nr:outer membrane protein assembly factor BamE [Rodentibacter heylii]
MKIKSFLAATLLTFTLASCSTVQKVVYRIDVPQGNYLDASSVAQVKPGMNSEQVQYLLGTPMLIDPYSQYTWYYIYLQQRAYQAPEQHTFVVNFDTSGIVSEINLDKALPESSQQNTNNTIINAAQLNDKSWWQFWK